MRSLLLLSCIVQHRNSIKNSLNTCPKKYMASTQFHMHSQSWCICNAMSLRLKIINNQIDCINLCIFSRVPRRNSRLTQLFLYPQANSILRKSLIFRMFQYANLLSQDLDIFNLEFLSDNKNYYQ